MEIIEYKQIVQSKGNITFNWMTINCIEEKLIELIIKILFRKFNEINIKKINSMKIQTHTNEKVINLNYKWDIN